MAGWDRRRNVEDDDFGGFSDPFDSSDEGFSDQSEAVLLAHRDLPPKQRWQRAAIDGNLQELKKAKEDGFIDVDVHLDGGWTALMYASSFSQPEIVRYLMEIGANPNYHYEALTPLMCACLSTSMYEICNFASVKLLLDNNAMINFTDRYGQTALMKAIETGKNLVVSILIPVADLEIKDSHGKTAVFYAVEYNREEILEWLIDAGVELNIADKHKTSLKSLVLSKDYNPIKIILKDLLKDEEELRTDYLRPYMYKTTWQQMFPNILDSSPAYFCDIPKLLNGMYCERLAPLFEQHNVDLTTFLTMSDDDLKNINVVFPYQRKLILSGIYKFHIYRWNTNIVLGISKQNEFEFQNYVNYIAAHLKYMRIVNSSMTYINKMTKLKLVKDNTPSNLNPSIDDIIAELKKIRLEVEKSRVIINEINKQKIPSGDLIKPKESVQRSVLSKKSFIFITTVIVIVFTIVKL